MGIRYHKIPILLNIPAEQLKLTSMLSNVYFTAMLLIPFMIQQALSTLCFRRSQFLVLGVCSSYSVCVLRSSSVKVNPGNATHTTPCV